MSDEQLQRVNSLLENPPPFDPVLARTSFGLFVAGSARQAPRTSRSGLRPVAIRAGTTAIVLISAAHGGSQRAAHAKDPGRGRC